EVMQLAFMPRAGLNSQSPGCLAQRRRLRFSLFQVGIMVDSHYVLPNDIGIATLDCAEAFELLSPEEKHYAHYLSRACWYGGLVVLLQTSPESPTIYVLLSRIFRTQDPSQLQEVARSVGVTDEEYQALLVYTAAIYANMGNYKSFGDTKFVPSLPKEKLKKVVWASQAFLQNPEEMEALWESCEKLMYSLEPLQRHLGLCGEGVSTYFSANCSMEDAKLAQKFLDSQNISAYNTRLFKTETRGKTSYEVRQASVLLDGNDWSLTFRSSARQPLCFFTSNTLPVQTEMLEHYTTSFKQGSIPAHKEGSRCWIRDKSPIVESYIGFIESYRDPYGSRGEFEGFVAVVNKAMSAKFAQLVAQAEHLLEELPWPRAFEKDHFLKPDFTSLDVLTFAGSGIPAGINIPNYDDIRQTEGFKNVSLGNVLAVAYATQKEKLTFLAEEDKVRLKLAKFEDPRLRVTDEHSIMFFSASPPSPIQIRSWYQGGETWDSKFSSVASSYEECRAECVGLYLCLNKDVLRIFELKGEDAENVIYINWLNMVRAGLLALEFYTPESGSWRQAHMQARFVILRVLLEAGEGLVSLRHTTGTDGKPDAVVLLDRTKITTVGKPALEGFLRKLQILKSTADVEGGRKLYEAYSAVTDSKPECFLTLRETVLLRKEARKLFVQANTRLEGGKVRLTQYEASAAGLIRSFSERFSEDAKILERELLELTHADARFWES
uniref:Dipeptidyl peptidase 3 n=1 Tax=Naja naja TaxID=35670 RepID=A0A8C6VSC8_NAJNA